MLNLDATKRARASDILGLLQGVEVPDVGSPPGSPVKLPNQQASLIDQNSMANDCQGKSQQLINKLDKTFSKASLVEDQYESHLETRQ